MASGNYLTWLGWDRNTVTPSRSIDTVTSYRFRSGMRESLYLWTFQSALTLAERELRGRRKVLSRRLSTRLMRGPMLSSLPTVTSLSWMTVFTSMENGSKSSNCHMVIFDNYVSTCNLWNSLRNWNYIFYKVGIEKLEARFCRNSTNHSWVFSWILVSDFLRAKVRQDWLKVDNNNIILLISNFFIIST